MYLSMAPSFSGKRSEINSMSVKPIYERALYFFMMQGKYSRDRLPTKRLNHLRRRLHQLNQYPFAADRQGVVTLGMDKSRYQNRSRPCGYPPA